MGSDIIAKLDDPRRPPAALSRMSEGGNDSHGDGGSCPRSPLLGRFLWTFLMAASFLTYHIIHPCISYMQQEKAGRQIEQVEL